MQSDIAVFRGSDGSAAAFGIPGTVSVYRRRRQGWTLERELEFVPDTAAGLKGFRRQMADLLAFLGDCRIFVAASLTGMPYYELEKAGFSIWEQSGEPSAFLEAVWRKEEEEEQAKAAAEAELPLRIGPEEKAPGQYYLSLKEIQAKQAGVTSKQALRPFLQQGGFSTLEVICDHLPPWLEADLQTGAYIWSIEKLKENEFKLIIKRQSRG